MKEKVLGTIGIHDPTNPAQIQYRKEMDEKGNAAMFVAVSAIALAALAGRALGRAMRRKK